MAYVKDSMYITARVKVCLKLHPDRITSSHKIIKDSVDHRLVRNSVVAVAINV